MGGGVRRYDTTYDTNVSKYTDTARHVVRHISSQNTHRHIQDDTPSDTLRAGFGWELVLYAFNSHDFTHNPPDDAQNSRKKYPLWLDDFDKFHAILRIARFILEKNTPYEI